jgi:hypothetical protein
VEDYYYMERRRKAPLLILVTIIIIAMILFMVYLFFFDDSLSGEKVAPFNVPEKENILSVTVQDGDGMYIYDDAIFIDEFTNILLDIESKAQDSLSDSPNVEGSVYVYISCVNEEDNMGFFAYTKKKNTYVEIPYAGIWKAPPALYYLVTAGTLEN